MGDAAEGFTFEKLNQALRLILDGADILALEMDRYWMQPEGLVLSAGPFVALLEYATGKKAAAYGKALPQFLSDGTSRPRNKAKARRAMIGDDIHTDVHGAQEMGMQGILVKTGKYREENRAKLVECGRIWCASRWPLLYIAFRLILCRPQSFSPGIRVN